jgi:mRNA interferase RelE/StbE
MAEKITVVKRYKFTRRFQKDYKALPNEIQKAFDKKLKLFLDNSLHPSLRVKRIQGTKDRWEGSVTMKYRFTFHIDESTAIFRTIGTHDILKRS